MFATPEEDGSTIFSAIGLAYVYTDYNSGVDLIRATSHAIRHVLSGSHSPQKAHERVRNFYYSWEDITGRIERVYEDAMIAESYNFWTRVRRYV